MAKELKFDSAQAERQYHQILARDSRVCREMWGCVALQYLSADGKPLKRFERQDNLLLAVATSGQVDEYREISRFTILRGSEAVVDWDLTRVCRDSGPRHVPNRHSRFFEFALALDSARAVAATTPPLPNLNKFKKPQAFVHSVAPAALPVADSDGNIKLIQRLKPQGLSAMELVDQVKTARAAMLAESIETEDGWFTPINAVHPELVSSAEYLDMDAFTGVHVKNPLARYLQVSNPWVGLQLPTAIEEIDAFLQAHIALARKSLGSVGPLFSDEDILEAAVDIDGRPSDKPLRATGRRVPTVAELEPLLKRELGSSFEQISAKQLAQMVALPANPILVKGIGKPMFFFKGFGSNTDALRRVGIEYPELPSCFLPWERQ